MINGFEFEVSVVSHIHSSRESLLLGIIIIVLILLLDLFQNILNWLASKLM